MRVLTISNDYNYRSFLSRKLNEALIETTECELLEDAVTKLKQDIFDVLICCLPLLSKSGPLEVVHYLRQSANDAAIIIISDNIQLHTAMSLVREGVYSCFNRPFPLEQLSETLAQLKNNKPLMKMEPVVRKTVNQRIIFSERKYVKGISLVARNMYSQIDLVGPTCFSVIIYGETGTGKEAVAYRVASLKDPSAPYIAVDCGCLSKELALSELFGHEKGSFTGAVTKKIGAFELANNGTLFLDEIGNLDYEVQGYLLRAIQERKIRRIGGTEDISVQTRIIVASNENLAAAVKAGKFREDLYHRLNEFEIAVPPLKMRPDDLPIFIDQFVAETNIELGKKVRSPKDATTLFALLRYNWPGNIRELKNVIRRACLLCPDEAAISIAHLPVEIVHFEEERLKNINANEISAFMQYKKPRNITLKEIEEALKVTNYNKTKAARYLGIDRKTLYNRLRIEHT